MNLAKACFHHRKGIFPCESSIYFRRWYKWVRETTMAQYQSYGSFQMKTYKCMRFSSIIMAYQFADKKKRVGGEGGSLSLSLSLTRQQSTTWKINLFN
jgi:hypothetical protein